MPFIYPTGSSFHPRGMTWSPGCWAAATPAVVETSSPRPRTTRLSFMDFPPTSWDAPRRAIGACPFRLLRAPHHVSRAVAHLAQKRPRARDQPLARRVVVMVLAGVGATEGAAHLRRERITPRVPARELGLERGVHRVVRRGAGQRRRRDREAIHAELTERRIDLLVQATELLVAAGIVIRPHRFGQHATLVHVAVAEAEEREHGGSHVRVIGPGLRVLWPRRRTPGP